MFEVLFLTEAMKKTSSAFEVNEKQLSLSRCLLVGSRPLKPLTYGKVR